MRAADRRLGRCDGRRGLSRVARLAESIPIALAGRDILARAKNGTGKTAGALHAPCAALSSPLARGAILTSTPALFCAAFCVPVLEKVDTSRNEIQGERRGARAREQAGMRGTSTLTIWRAPLHPQR